MNFDVRCFIEYINAHPADIPHPSISTLPDFLTHFYLLYAPLPEDGWQELYLGLVPAFPHLSKRKLRIIRRAIEQTAARYTHAAFKQGLLVGARLVLELDSPFQDNPS